MFKKMIFLSITVFSMVLLSGCTTAETLASGIAEKAISGSGVVAKNKVGIDASTKMPTVDSTIVNGEYTSVPSGMKFLEYTESEDASIFNSNAKTSKRRLVFASSPGEDDEKQFNSALEMVKELIEKKFEDEKSDKSEAIESIEEK